MTEPLTISKHNNANFTPFFKWEGVVYDVLEDKVLAKVYDSVNDLYSEIEIDIGVIKDEQLKDVERGVLFYLYSGLCLDTMNDSLLFELRMCNEE